MEIQTHKRVFITSGYLTTIGSALLTVGYWMRPYVEKQFVRDFAGNPALYSTILVGLGTLILLCGLPALFFSQMKSEHRPRFLWLALTFAGIASFHLGTLSLYFVLPVLVDYSKDTYDLIAQDVPPFPRFAIFWALSLLVQVVGLIPYGIKMLKIKIFPRVATIALIVGALLLIVSPAIDFRLLQPAVTLIMSGFLFYGIALIRNFIGSEIK